MRFTGKTALVTGGSRGIGRAIVEGLAQGGARVMVGYKENQAAAESVVAELKARSAVAECHQVDVGDAASVAALVAATERHFGPVDILVNSAGLVYRRTLEAVTLSEWEEVLRVNLTGTFLLTHAVAPGMAARRYGRVVNLASLAGRNGGRVAAHYAAAKGGVIAFTANVARELASRGLTVNCIAPDMTDTDMVESLSLGPLKEVFLSSSPMGRLVRTEEVAAVALFLASAEASFVNGECIGVTGGR